MSTRATYQLPGGTSDVRTAFYIHHDGNPQGAATYFQKMLERWPTSKGGYAEAFLRANDGAEITGGHEAHNDTEWRYSLNPNGHLSVLKRSFDFRHNEMLWSADCHRSLHGWINHVVRMAGAPYHWLEDARSWENWRFVGGKWWQKTALEKAVREQRGALKKYAALFPDLRGNIDCMERDRKKLERAFDDYLIEELGSA